MCLSIVGLFWCRWGNFPIPPYGVSYISQHFWSFLFAFYYSRIFSFLFALDFGVVITLMPLTVQPTIIFCFNFCPKIFLHSLFRRVVLIGYSCSKRILKNFKKALSFNSKYISILLPNSCVKYPKQKKIVKPFGSCRSWWNWP